MRNTSWKNLPFKDAVESHGSGSAGLPQKEWTSVGKFPVIGQGVEDIEGWTDRDDLLLTPHPAVVLYGGHTRRVKHVSHPFVPGPNVKILKPAAGLDSKFLYYFLSQLPIESKGYADHFPLVRKFDVPVPPLAEQQRIVRLLDEAFRAIAIAKANAEKNLQNARALFGSQLQYIFDKGGDGWETKKVSEIATHSLGKMLDKAKNKGEFRRYLRNLNVRWAEFDLSDVLEMRFLPGEAERYTVLKGDVLVCEGGYPGRAAIWDSDEPIYFQKALHRVRFHESDRNRWFIYYLMAKDADGTLKSHFNGTGIQHFTGEALSRFEVPLPPLREQKKILDRLDELREMSLKLTSAYASKVAALDHLKAVFLNAAFSGNLLKAA